MGTGPGSSGKASPGRGRRVVVKFASPLPGEAEIDQVVARSIGVAGEAGQAGRAGEAGKVGEAVRPAETGEVGPGQDGIDETASFTVGPYIGETEQAALEDLVALASESDESFQPVDFSSYVAVTLRPDIEAERVVERLRESDGVENAYVEGGPTPPPVVNPADDPSQPNQGYENAAPDGIDAEYAWGFPGGDGAGIGFVDLEQGWTLNHQDLVAAGITLISGTNQAYFGHGTAVLGEVSGVDNNLGIVGIAPSANARVVSQYRPGGGYNTAEAILSAVAVMDFGDVLLLEAQTTAPGVSGYMPVEVEDAVFNAIRLATALGIVVVEAGGNGSENLDAYSDPVLGQVLNRGSASFRDSGAIVVGAASSTVPHSRLGFSNFGSRVDCYGWGGGITTTGDGWTGNSTTTYTAGFGGTSGASPIVTGAALLVQGMVEATRGYRFSPRQMREILADPANGTPSNAPATDLIGSMPDLRAILQSNDLNLTPDVYLRDFVGDLGEPHTGSISSSPDIILRPTAVANPQAAFGAGSGTESSYTLGFEAESGQDNFVYVRVLNQGGSAATNVEATVYWSPPATLVTPNMWTLVGSTVIPSVPVGEILTVSDGITWPSASIPGVGHYCFVGILGNDLDPAPDPRSLLDWDQFMRFIRDNNNVTWRNFNVVNNLPPAASSGGPPGFVALEFLVVGAPDRARPLEFEVIAKLPEGARLRLEAPDFLADIWHRRQLRQKVGEAPGAQMAVSPQGITRFGEAVLPRELQAPCRLLVEIPEESRRRTYQIAARQLYEGREVGRVTWRLVPKRELDRLVERERARE